MDRTPPDDERTRELALALHGLAWRIARFGPAEVGLDPLPTSELAVLRSVLDAPDRSVSEVAAATSMRSSNVSAAVRSLIERGLVIKRPHPGDGRVALLRPSRRALADREAIENAIAGSVAAALTDLPADQLDALLAAVPAMGTLAEAVAAQMTAQLAKPSV